MDAWSKLREVRCTPSTRERSAPKGNLHRNFFTTPTASRRPCDASVTVVRANGSRSTGRRRCRWLRTGWQSCRAAEHPEHFAFLYGETRGQMRDLITRFTHAVGSPNAVSHDSLNIEASKLGHLLTQGIYDLPAYDLENTNYVLSFGSSLLEAGRTVQRFIAGYSYMRRGRPQRGKIVVIDPRQGISGAKADEWIPIRPGTDAALALGMAHVLISANLVDHDFVDHYAFGYDDWTDATAIAHQGFKSLVLDHYDPATVEEITGVSAGTIARLAGEFASNQPGVAIVPAKGGLLNGSVNGLYTAMAIHALNALVGNLEKTGGVMVQHYPACPGWPELPPDPVAAAGREVERVDGAGSVFPLARHAYQAVAGRILEGYPVERILPLRRQSPLRMPQRPCALDRSL